MGDNSAISWTDATWNPIIGCKRVSPGCDHCYAFAEHDRRHIAWKRGTFSTAPVQYHKPFSQIQLMEDRLDQPFHWRRPRRIFVNSLSDLFHEDVPGEYINRIWMTMFNARHHIYQVLTKRPERLLEWTRRKAAATTWPIKDIWPSWVWVGVSVENQEMANQRIPILLKTPAAVRFLSCEPLLGPLLLHLMPGYLYNAIYEPARGTLKELDWVIAGGESGLHYREMNLDWARSLRDQCVDAGVPFFYKQSSGPRSGMNPTLDGVEWHQYPAAKGA